VEFLGELLSKYGEKKTYGIINRGAKLLDGFPEDAQEYARSYFINNGVQVYLDISFTPDKSIKDDYDMIIMCAGQKFYTPFMDNDKFKD